MLTREEKPHINVDFGDERETVEPGEKKNNPQIMLSASSKLRET